MIVCVQAASDFSTYAGPAATIFAALAALCVTAYFAWHQKKIANAQAFIAKEKLRLDLYDRRFKIFSSVFDFYPAMLGWKTPPTPEQTAARDKFFRAYLESQFLFKKTSGIEDLLKHLYDQAVKVIDFKENAEFYKHDKEYFQKSFFEAQDIMVREFDEGAKNLKTKIGEYLNFYNIDIGSKM